MGILCGAGCDVIDALKPYKCRCSSNALPERFELGTPQIELMAGLSAAVDYFAGLGTAAGESGSRRAKDRQGVRNINRLREPVWRKS